MACRGAPQLSVGCRGFDQFRERDPIHFGGTEGGLHHPDAGADQIAKSPQTIFFQGISIRVTILDIRALTLIHHHGHFSIKERQDFDIQER